MKYRESSETDETVVDEDVLLALAMGQQQYTGRAYRKDEQLKLMTGWNAVGIQTLCDVACSATADIFDSGQASPQAKALRSQLRFKYGPSWKSMSAGRETGDPAAPDFRWWRLIEQPNPWQTGRSHMIDVIQQLQIHGNCFVWNVKNQVHKTVWRFVLPAALLTAVSPGRTLDGVEMPSGGVRVSALQSLTQFYNDMYLDAGAVQRFIATRVIPFEDLTLYARPHPYFRGDGFSPSSAGEAWIKLLQEAEAAQGEQYSKKGRKRAIVTPNELAIKNNLSLSAWQRAIDQKIKESDHDIVALAEVGTIHELDTTPDAMAYMEAVKQYGPMVLALHRVPREAAGLGDGATYGSVSARMQAFTVLGVQPILDLKADEDTATMRKEEGDGLTIEYTAPQYNDPELELERLKVHGELGTMECDEVREREGLPAWGGERGKLPAGSDAAKNWGAPKQPPAIQPGRMMTIDAPKPAGNLIDDRKQEEMVDRKLRESEARQEKAMVPPGVDRYRDDPPPVFAFDLDGTLAEDSGEFDPNAIGIPREGVVELLRLMRAAGLGIVVFTCRNSDRLVADWLNEHDIPFDGINENPWFSGTSGKVYAERYIDDRAVSARTTEGIAMLEILSALTDRPEYHEKMVEMLDRRHFDRRYKYFCYPVAGKARDHIAEIQAKIDPNHLSSTGLETELHITALYGVVHADPHEVALRLGMLGRPNFSTAKHITVFPSKSPSDAKGGERAAVVELDSEDLHSLHELLGGLFPHVQTFPVYRPHITLGYIKEEHAAEYDGMAIPSIAADVSKLIFRQPESPDMVIPLR